MKKIYKFDFCKNVIFLCSFVLELKYFFLIIILYYFILCLKISFILFIYYNLIYGYNLIKFIYI